MKQKLIQQSGWLVGSFVLRWKELRKDISMICDDSWADVASFNKFVFEIDVLGP